MLAAVVFDFDGVIANSEPLHLSAWQETLAGMDVALSAEDYYSRYLGYDDEAMLANLAADRALPWDGPRRADLIARKTRLLPELLVRPEVLFPGAVACVGRLRAVAPLAIASGAIRDEIELVLKASRLVEAFSVIVAAGETPRGKPSPDPYARAVALLGEQGMLRGGNGPGQCVAIEDSRWGLEAAAAAGLRTVGVTTSYSSGELEDAADVVVGGLDEVTPALLERLVTASRSRRPAQALHRLRQQPRRRRPAPWRLTARPD